jgi:hypothetical protein
VRLGRDRQLDGENADGVVEAEVEQVELARLEVLGLLARQLGDRLADVAIVLPASRAARNGIALFRACGERALSGSF